MPDPILALKRGAATILLISCTKIDVTVVAGPATNLRNGCSAAPVSVDGPTALRGANRFSPRTVPSHGAIVPPQVRTLPLSVFSAIVLPAGWGGRTPPATDRR